MIVTRYKPLFSVSATYELASTGISAEGITVSPAAISETKMDNLKLKPQYTQNTSVIFYEGKEQPENAPLTSEPYLEIATDEYFYFNISLSDKEKIKGLKFHSTGAVAKEIGFPLLYDASINVLAGPTVINSREDVKVVSPVFTFTAKAADTGITANYASLEIRNEKTMLVDLNIPQVQRNDKQIDGVGAIPEFAFSVDASRLEAGIYEFKIGTFKKKFFLANLLDVSDTVALVRVLKNDFLEYKKSLADKTFAQFSLMIPKA